MRFLLLILLVLVLIGVLPLWPHSVTWGYAPTGGVGLVVLVVLIVLIVA